MFASNRVTFYLLLHLLVEGFNDTWLVTPLRDWSANHFDQLGGNAIVEEYSHPVYTYLQGIPEWDAGFAEIGLSLDERPSLVYSGDRWFAMWAPRGNVTLEEEIFMVREYHGEFFIVALSSFGCTQDVDKLCFQLSPQRSGIEPTKKIQLILYQR